MQLEPGFPIHFVIWLILRSVSTSWGSGGPHSTAFLRGNLLACQHLQPRVGDGAGGENISVIAARHFQLLIDHEMILSVHMVLQGSGQEQLDVITAHKAWLLLVFPWLLQRHQVTQATDATWPDEATPIITHIDLSKL